MDLTLTAEDRNFRAEVRHFFENDYPQALLHKARSGQTLTREDHADSQKALQSRGWFAANWPAEFGGPGWSPTQRYLFEEELDRAGALNVIPMGVIYVGPVIYTFGNDWQKRDWLPDILESRSFWAQGYSEPEAGSDLAGLRTRAERDGDHYVVNGTKIWTTLAQWADWIFCLVRTSQEERRQDGISFLCFRMDTPGVTLTPIRSIDGSHHLNKIDFDNVRVPVANRIGDEGRGWHYAQFLLTNERLSYAHVSRKKQHLAQLRVLAAQTPWRDGSVADNPVFMYKIADCETQVAVFEVTVLRALCAGASAPITLAPAIKILATELAQKVTELQLELAGPNALPWLDRNSADWIDAIPDLPAFAPVATTDYFFERAQTIYGGATEIQKNIMGRALLKAAAG
ncbi:MAG: hypothetical protein JWQ90_2404 [Hydrocarboniphaga sp.]|uniref:acyl-CoA dehydrogenase family protein n=1 Tax=Hydrocarboniphaga sp. TaxID=2033016 RepID=UPI0026116C47|nr:acyl-CoA dehydrogenase family protein [Hydrocarboniphaga sp.]MDB5969954.1 hypothetical protein [Hydrocarboniphaga sp.]